MDTQCGAATINNHLAVEEVMSNSDTLQHAEANRHARATTGVLDGGHALAVELNDDALLGVLVES